MFLHTLSLCLLSLFFLLLLFHQTYHFPFDLLLLPPLLFALFSSLLTLLQLRTCHPLPFRLTELKIALLEHFLLFAYLVILALAHHIPARVPFTGTCIPLGCVLVQRFLWYRSFIKAFRGPGGFVKWVYQVLAVNLAVNLALKWDSYYVFDVIALLWPCYGFIALSFIFFIATLLLFIGSACNEFQNLDDAGHEVSARR